MVALVKVFGGCILLAAVAASMGCTRSFRFRVVDAQTDRPLPGVSITRESRWGRGLTLLRTVRSDLPKTNAAGETGEDRVPEDANDSYFVIQLTGYQDALVYYAPAANGEALLYSPFKGLQGTTVPVKETIQVRLVPTTAPATTAPATTAPAP